MRTLIVSSSYPPSGWGGAEVAAEGIAGWLHAHGHEVAVYTDSGPAETSEGGVRRYLPARRTMQHRADQHSKQNGARKALWHLTDHLPRQGYREFSAVVGDFRPDLVMIHLAPGFGVGLFECCARRDLAVVYVMHDFWLTCLRSSMFSKTGGSCTRREWYCRWSSSIRWNALSKIRRLGVWAPSAKVIGRVKSELGDVFGQVLVEHNIVDFGDFRVPPARIAKGPVRFLYVGKVTPAKGVPFVLECLASLPPGCAFEVDIVGTGDAEESLRAAYRGDPRFHFHGLRNRSQVIRHYQAASVLLVPSLWFEPAGLVIYQAQSASLPVIGSDSGGIPDLLADRPDSRVLGPGDREAWKSTLRELIENRASLEVLQSAAARLSATGPDVLDSRAARVVGFCQGVINRRPEGALA